MRVVIFIRHFNFFFLLFFNLERTKKASRKNLFAEFYIIKKESFFYYYYYILDSHGFSRRARLSKLLTFNFYSLSHNYPILIDECQKKTQKAQLSNTLILKTNYVHTFLSERFFEKPNIFIVRYKKFRTY